MVVRSNQFNQKTTKGIFKKIPLLFLLSTSLLTHLGMNNPTADPSDERAPRRSSGTQRVGRENPQDKYKTELKKQERYGQSNLTLFYEKDWDTQFLTNFAQQTERRGDKLFLEIEGRMIKNVELYFQASKFGPTEGSQDVTQMKAFMNDILNSEGSQAAIQKAREWQGFIRPNFHTVKISIMCKANYLKYSQQQAYQDRLCRTGNSILIEHSQERDWFWGNGLPYKSPKTNGSKTLWDPVLDGYIHQAMREMGVSYDPKKANSSPLAGIPGFARYVPGVNNVLGEILMQVRAELCQIPTPDTYLKLPIVKNHCQFSEDLQKNWLWPVEEEVSEHGQEEEVFGLSQNQNSGTFFQIAPPQGGAAVEYQGGGEEPAEPGELFVEPSLPPSSQNLKH